MIAVIVVTVFVVLIGLVVWVVYAHGTGSSTAKNNSSSSVSEAKSKGWFSENTSRTENPNKSSTNAERESGAAEVSFFSLSNTWVRVVLGVSAVSFLIFCASSVPKLLGGENGPDVVQENAEVVEALKGSIFENKQEIKHVKERVTVVEKIVKIFSPGPAIKEEHPADQGKTTIDEHNRALGVKNKKRYDGTMFDLKGFEGKIQGCTFDPKEGLMRPGNGKQTITQGRGTKCVLEKLGDMVDNPNLKLEDTKYGWSFYDPNDAFKISKLKGLVGEA